MDIKVGQRYIITNVNEGFYGGCYDIVALDGQEVLVVNSEEYDSVGFSVDYTIVDSNDERHYVEAINLKEID